MNPLSLSTISLLATVTSSILITIPAFGQITTVPITGGSFSVTNPGGLNPGAVILTPIGTINVSAFQTNIFQNFNTGANTATGSPATKPDQPGDSVQIQGLGSGTLATTGVTFSNVPSVVNGKINSITFLPVGVTPPTSSLSQINITGGSLQLPTAIVSPASSTSVPVVGGNFNVTAFKDGSIVNNGVNLLTTLGTVSLNSFKYTEAFNQTTGFAPFTGGRFPIAGDSVSTEGLATGTAQLEGGKVAILNATPTFLRGVLTGVQITPPGATLGTQISETYLGNITSGRFLIPNSDISSTNSNTATNLLTDNFTILPNFSVSKAALFGQKYNAPPRTTDFDSTPEQSRFPALSGSRIHPGLGSRRS